MNDPSGMKTAELINGDVLIVNFHNAKVAILHAKDLQTQAVDEAEIYSRYMDGDNWPVHTKSQDS